MLIPRNNGILGDCQIFVGITRALPCLEDVALCVMSPVIKIDLRQSACVRVIRKEKVRERVRERVMVR